MKSSLLSIAGAALLLASCSQIDPDNRRVPAGDDFTPQRTVLIEEFTGQTCVNCPNGHSILKNLESKFNNIDHTGVISVGLHVREFGLPVAQGGFYTPEVDTYAAGFETAPSAKINRKTGILNSDQWTKAVLQEMQRPTSVTLPLLTAELHGGTITVAGEVVNSSSADLKNTKLQLWLVEDDITSWQFTSGGGVESAYNHHAVFRGAINGTNGATLELPAKKTTRFAPVTYPLPAQCSNDHLRIVAFIYTDSDGVLNATQAPVVPQ